jgi:Protein of unknown function (DUF1569)
MKNIFEKQVTDEIISRIEKLTPETRPLWGTMNVSQMLAHCNVTYELIYENKHNKPGAFKKLLLKMFVKNIVVNDKAYKRSSPTAPEFLIKGPRDFEPEKSRLISYIKRAQLEGQKAFEGKESFSFGKLNVQEWNNMFYKHLDHHLSQFGV